MPSDPVVPPAPIPFTRIPDSVLLDPRLSSVQLRIYAVIARRADRETAAAFPSYAMIAKDASISRTSAITGVAALVSLGYLSKRLQESGRGDLASNVYTIAGEGSAIYGRPGPNSVRDAPQMTQKLHHESAQMTPPVVQELDAGGATAVPELDSKNQRQKNQNQENQDARASTREDAAAAATPNDPEPEVALAAFQEQIAALPSTAKAIITQLVQEYGADWVLGAIRDSAIFEQEV